MKFSELFGLGNQENAEWLDPILSIDTRLFIDPFLIYDQEFGAFVGSHDEVIAFFNTQFLALAQTGGNKDSNQWAKVQSDLVFPEVEELCLGYTGSGTGGAGSGPKLAKILVNAMWDAITQGMKDLRHFEEIGLIREGIGPDRISDITASLLRSRFAQYTSDVCTSLGVPLEQRHFIDGTFDVTKGRWVPLNANLPKNPYNGKGILLCPKRFVRNLPTIEAHKFWEWCYSTVPDVLRVRYGDDISNRVDKATIVDLARARPDLRAAFLAKVEKTGSQSYDLGKDPQGLREWYDATKAYCAEHAQPLEFRTEEEFAKFVKSLIETFQHYVEQNHGWKLLWNDNKSPRREEASQDLFLGIVKHYCKANDVDVSKEPNIGRGPVDFKMSSGFQRRALIEVKKADNSKFWNGLKNQLPTYQKAEQVQVGFFLVVAFSDKDLERVAGIREIVGEVNAATSYKIEAVVVDASADKPSASKL